jgi:U2 small nuclear ribonucleoprotein A'
VNLANFPLSPRLQTLLCAHNRITSIASNLSKNAPNLHTLVLSHNNISELTALDALQGLTKLQQLTLSGNPVTAKEVRYIDGRLADDNLADRGVLN